MLPMEFYGVIIVLLINIQYVVYYRGDGYMLKKILIIICVLLVALCAGEYLSGNFGLVGEVYFYVCSICLLQGVLFGCITMYISATKGYHGGFWWGFFLSLIGVLVVGFRPSIKENSTEDSENKPASNYISELEKLAALKERGIITEDEFNKKKLELLNRV